MPRPALFFFNEQDSDSLVATFSPDVITQLSLLNAGVAMGLRDLTAARAEVVRQLNDAHVPVTAWLLLPRDEGYFATHTNVEAVERAYARLVEWARAHHLRITGLGLDFEPDIRQLDELMARPTLTLARWLLRRGRGPLVEQARTRYQRLIERARGEGFRVETYQLPVIVDDRRAASQFWQRTMGALALDSDREVAMVYTSLLGMAGPGLLEHWAPHCHAIAVGSTGGGIDPFPKLSWAELERDLVVAARHAREVFIFSLEGCVEQGVLQRLASVEWELSVSRGSPSQRMLAAGAAQVIGALARWF
jgi:hypothetical protein